MCTQRAGPICMRQPPARFTSQALLVVGIGPDLFICIAAAEVAPPSSSAAILTCTCCPASSSCSCCCLEGEEVPHSPGWRCPGARMPAQPGWSARMQSVQLFAAVGQQQLGLGQAQQAGRPHLNAAGSSDRAGADVVHLANGIKVLAVVEVWGSLWVLHPILRRAGCGRQVGRQPCEHGERASGGGGSGGGSTASRKQRQAPRTA